MVEYLKNNGTFFEQLNRIKDTENIYKNTRIPSVANTYQNEPQFEKVLNKSFNFIHQGYEKYADTYPIPIKPYYDDYDGRNLNMLNTLKLNASRDKPDVITLNPLKVVGYY